MQVDSKQIVKALLPHSALAMLRHAKTAWHMRQSQKTHRAALQDVTLIADPDAHIWAGYYDVSPFSTNGGKLLAHRATGGNASPHDSGQLVEIGYIDRADQNRFIRLNTSYAWNWQQGSRLQWFDGNRVIFNSFAEGRNHALVQDITTGQVQRLNDPIYALSPDRRYALTLNFARLHRLRRGYGYHNLPDDSQGSSAPDDEGVWLLDLLNGQKTLLYRLSDLANSVAETGVEHYINHLDFAPDGRRFVFMHIWEAAGKRQTRLMRGDITGGPARPVTGAARDSHHRWLDDDSILVFTVENGIQNYKLFDLRNQTAQAIGTDVLNSDGHPSFIDRNTILTDTYPDAARLQSLMLYDGVRGQLETLGRFFAPPSFTGEMRCDLHPRLDHDLKQVCIDVVTAGRRAMAVLRLPPSA